MCIHLSETSVDAYQVQNSVLGAVRMNKKEEKVVKKDDNTQRVTEGYGTTIATEHKGKRK